MNRGSEANKRAESFGFSIVLLVIAVYLFTARPTLASPQSAWRAISIPGASDVETRGINDAGQVAGYYISASDNRGHGFLRNKEGSITTIDFSASASASTAIYGINNLGQMVGLSGGIDFIRDPSGVITTISLGALAINDSGQLAGLTQKGSFVTAADGSTIVFNVPGSVNYSTIAWGINNAGEVVGEYETPLNGGQIHGFMRSADGTITTIDVAGAIATVATGIDNASQIVGYYTTAPASYPLRQQNHGFIRDADGTITSFDAPGVGSTQPNGIASSSGMIVANFSHNPQNGPPNIGLVRSCILCP